MKKLMGALAAVAALAAFAAVGPASAASLCAHVNSITQNGPVATANLTIVSAPCVVTIQAIDKSGVGHGFVTATSTGTFTVPGSGTVTVTGPCGVDWETDVVLGLGQHLYGDDPDLLAQTMSPVACTKPPTEGITPPPTTTPPPTLTVPNVPVPQDGTRNIYCSGLTGATLNLLQSQVYSVGLQFYATWTDSTGLLVTVPVTVAPYYEGVGAACLYWPLRFHPTGLEVRPDGTPVTSASTFGYPFWARS